MSEGCVTTSKSGVKNTRRYAYEEALVAAVKSGHYGPWA